MKMFLIIFANIVLFLPFTAYCQKTLLNESFDAVNPPQLPQGWETSHSGSALTPDTKTTASISHSAPNTLIISNAKKFQWIFSPSLHCSSNSAIKLEFFDRRSTTFTSDIVVEISNDDGNTYTKIGERLKGTVFNVYVKHSIDVSLTEETQNIRIRWNIVGNGSGSTATYRLDDITISSVYRLDVGIQRITATPRFPQRNESVTISGCVINYGTAIVYDAYIALAYDANGDSLITADEFVWKNSNTVIAVSDSFPVEYTLGSLRPQRYRYALMVSSVEDANSSNDILWIDFFVSPAANSIAINEVMPAPHPSEPEWIELYMIGNDTISFEGFCLEKHGAKILFTGDNHTIKIPPSEYVVVTRDTALLKKYYALTKGLFIQIPLTDFFFNNNEGEVILRDANNRIIDSLHYSSSWGSGAGTSLERINALDPPEPLNWTGSRNPHGGTPGMRNSVSRKEKDVSIKNFYSEITEAQPITMVLFNAILVNRGIDGVAEVIVNLFEDTNNDSILIKGEHIASLQVLNFAAGTEKNIQIGPLQGKSGIHRYALTISFPGDEDTILEVSWNTMNAGYPQKSLVINEIMFAPREGEAEYVELWNNSNEDIDLTNWKISDAVSPGGTTGHAFIIPSSKTIRSKGYFVIASDSSFFKTFSVSEDFLYIVGKSNLSLNNDADAIQLFDPSGTLIDSVWYSTSWHHPDRSITTGISLERICPSRSSLDRQNWTSSTAPDGGTPGKQNSVFLESDPQTMTISISPNPFSPDGDGVDDEVAISAEFPSTTVTIRVKIFDTMGRLVKTLAEGNPVGSSYSVRWNGMNNNDHRCRIGLYILYIEAIDGPGGVNYTVKRPIVLARHL